jgi:hypothetical protein
LFSDQCYFAFRCLSLGKRLGILSLALRPGRKFGSTRSFRSQFCLTYLVCGFALGGSRRASLIYRDPLKALLFESGLLASGTILFQHPFFDIGGIIPTL